MGYYGIGPPPNETELTHLLADRNNLGILKVLAELTNNIIHPSRRPAVIPLSFFLDDATLLEIVRKLLSETRHPLFTLDTNPPKAEISFMLVLKGKLVTVRMLNRDIRPVTRQRSDMAMHDKT